MVFGVPDWIVWLVAAAVVLAILVAAVGALRGEGETLELAMEALELLD